MKELDNAITAKAVDALLNFETVRLFGNEAMEARQYDQSLGQYQVGPGQAMQRAACGQGYQEHPSTGFLSCVALESGVSAVDKAVSACG